MGGTSGDWWRIGQRPFRSQRRGIGPLINWARGLGLTLFSRWYLGPLLEQQNEVNRELAARLEAAQETAEVAQETAVALDRELTDLRRQLAEAVYRLQEQRRQLEAQRDALRVEVEDRSPHGEGP